jgi:ATP-dependent DNA helicase DinG
MSDSSAAARERLAEGGALADAIPAFVPRASQQRLSAAVADAFDAHGDAARRSGHRHRQDLRVPGSGAAVGQKTIISDRHAARCRTSCILRDLPRVRDALGIADQDRRCSRAARITCVKHRLETREGRAALVAIANRSRSSSASSLGRPHAHGRPRRTRALPEDSPLLPMVTQTAENLLGSECPFWSECFVVQARQRRRRRTSSS